MGPINKLTIKVKIYHHSLFITTRGLSTLLILEVDGPAVRALDQCTESHRFEFEVVDSDFFLFPSTLMT